MDRGTWQATIHGVTELDMTVSEHTHTICNPTHSQVPCREYRHLQFGGGGMKRSIFSTTRPQHIIREKAQIQELVLVWVLRLDINSKLDACAGWVASIVSDSSWPYGPCPPGFSDHGILQARILEWVSMLSLQGLFLTQGSNLHLHLLHWQVGSLPLSHLGSPVNWTSPFKFQLFLVEWKGCSSWSLSSSQLKFPWFYDYSTSN